MSCTRWLALYAVVVVVGCARAPEKPAEDPIGRQAVALAPPDGVANWSLGSVGAFVPNFGNYVAAAGDVDGDGFDDVLASSTSHGRVYLLRGTAAGVSDTALSVLESPVEDLDFGGPIAGVGDLDGDGYADVVVGGTTANVEPGFAFVYRGSPSGLSASPDVTLTQDRTFGGAVSGAGDVNGDGWDDLVVGAVNADDAYVYYGSPVGVTESSYTTLEGYGGASVTGVGDVNGDGFDDVLVGDGDGTFAVFGGAATRMESSPASTVAGPRNSDPRAAAAGDVDGDGFDDVLLSWTAGTAAVYSGSASGLGEAPLSTLVGSASEGFGQLLAGLGDVNADGCDDVAIGAPLRNQYVGAVFVHLGGPSGVGTTAAWTAEGASDQSLDRLSRAGDTNGDGYADLAVGSPQFGENSGAVWVFAGSASADLSSVVQVEHSDDRLGMATSPAGDVNGDGYDDVVIGAYGEHGNTGAASLFLGSAIGLASTASATFAGAEVEDRFGFAVAGGGDWNGDGFDDLVVTAYRADSVAGAAYLYAGSALGISSASGVKLTAGSGYYFGQLLAAGADFNGDGFDDLVVSDENASRGGLLIVYPGGRTGPDARSAAFLPVLHHDAVALAGAGDVDGDGYDELLVGIGDSVGKVYIYAGSSSGLARPWGTTLAGDALGDGFGEAIAAAGDVNGDGFADIVVGAPEADDDAGRAYVYLGSAAGISTSAALDLGGGAAGEGFGTAVAGIGDVDADGYDDVAIGAPGADGVGSVTVLHGSADGVSTAGAEVLLGAGHLGTRVVAAGDVNGDGWADLLASDSSYLDRDHAVYLYEGYSDADGDGVRASEDCDDGDAGAGRPSEAYYADADADGYTDPGSSVVACVAPDGYAPASVSADCDDADAAIHPGATEVPADGIDQDCDGADDAPMDTAEDSAPPGDSDSGGDANGGTVDPPGCAGCATGGAGRAGLVGLAVCVAAVSRRRRQPQRTAVR